MKENIIEIEIDKPLLEIDLTVNDGKVSLIFDELNDSAQELDEIRIENENLEIVEEDDDLIEEEIENISAEDDFEIWKDDEINDLEDFSEDFLDDIDLVD